MNKYARPLILILALAALAASIAALYVHYRIIKDPTYSSFCDISETVSSYCSGAEGIAFKGFITPQSSEVLGQLRRER